MLEKYINYKDWITPVSMKAQSFHDEFMIIDGQVYYDLSIGEYNQKYGGKYMDDSPEDLHYWLEKTAGVITDKSFVQDFEQIQQRRYSFLKAVKYLRYLPALAIISLAIIIYQKRK